MKKNMILALLSLLILWTTTDYAGLFTYFRNSSPQAENSNKIRIPLGINEKKEQLERLKVDLKDFEATESEFNKTFQTNLDQNTSSINETKEKLSTATQADLPFLNKVLSTLNETYQILFNLQFFRKEYKNTIEQHIALLESYLKDPDLKSSGLTTQSFYTFDDLQEMSQKLTLQEDNLNHLLEQKNEAIIDLDNSKRKISTVSKEFEDKKKQQIEFSSKTKESKEGMLSSDFDFKQLGRLIDLEKNFLFFEKQLAEFKAQTLTRKLALLDTTIAIEADKSKIYRSNIIKIKDGLRIEPKDIQKAKEKLEVLKKESLAIRDKLYATIKELSVQRDSTVKELEQLKKQYNNIGDITALGIGNWNIVPNSVQEWIKLCDIGLKESQISLLETKIDTIRSTIDLEIYKFKRKDIDYTILTSWYKITRRQFKSNDEILDDLKSYQTTLAELSREETSIKDKRNSLSNLIAIRNKNLTSLKNLIIELKQSKNSTFKSNNSKYIYCLSRLNQTEKIAEEQLGNNNQLLKNYADLITLINGTQKNLINIVNELETKSIWQRSEYAISLNGIKNVGSDLIFFAKDVQKLFSYFIFGLYGKVRSALNRVVYHPFNLIIFIIKIAFMLFLYWFIKTRLLQLILSNKNYEPHNKSTLIISKIAEFLLTFASLHFSSFFIWLLLFCCIYFGYVTDNFLQVIFYLGSILYFSYLIYRFINNLIKFNERNNYVLFNQFFQKRFTFVFALFAYLSVILLFFREAFIVATYHASEFPTILLALYSVVIRTLIIFSIGKDEIISFLPQRGTAWKTVAEFIDRYYYLLLGIIIILMLTSDPYIGGYGNLVSYILWGLVGTAFLIKLLMLIQNYLKKKSSTLFFSIDEETIRERFVYAKTWYGLFVVLLFITFVSLGIILSFKIWGKSISLSDISSILNYGIYSTGFDQTIQQHNWLTPLKILVIILFIFAGFIIAFAINRFVLNRIFQLLPVDIGIQNTITSLTKYLIFIIAIFLGFNWGGLGNLLFGIGLVIASIGYIVREPIGDFISYFIILVQRPLKIGDLVKVNDALGVVRHITPRSVIIRSKNSFTIIMPNSTIINQPVLNWNYTRGFIAFDDILFTVPYTVDPLLVKSIAAEVLDANTDILKSPRPIIRLENFGQNGYEFMLRGFLSSNKTLDIWDIASNVRLALVQALQKNGISIAIPTRLIKKVDADR